MTSPPLKIVLSLLLSITLGSGAMLSSGHSRRSIDLAAKASSVCEADADDVLDGGLELGLPSLRVEALPPQTCWTCGVLGLTSAEVLLLDDHAPRGPPANQS